MENEYKRLSKLQNELPYVQLEKPYQKGWKRLWVLKPEVAKSENAEFYQNILDKLTEVQYHYDQSFKKPKRKGRWHRYYFDRMPRLRSISIYKWDAYWHKFTDEQRACFEKVSYWDENSQWETRYAFVESDLFEITVRPHMIYKVKLNDEVLEQEMAFIDDWLYKGRNQHRLQKLNGGYYKYWKSWYYVEKLRYVNPLKNKPLYKVLDACGYTDDFMPVVEDYGHNHRRY